MTDFVNTATYLSLLESPATTQLDYYTKNNASPDILNLVTLSNKAFGERYMQGIARDLFGLSKPDHTGHDMTLRGKKIEMKSARWGNKGTFKWQHIMPGHAYDYVLFALVDFQDIKFWLITKDAVLQNPTLFTVQGGAEGQGLWTPGLNSRNMTCVTDLCVPIRSREDLLRAISAQ
jgi:hypothetical protein